MGAPISTPSILVSIRVTHGLNHQSSQSGPEAALKDSVPETMSQRRQWGGGQVTPPGLVPSAGNGFSPLYTVLCISIKANGMKQNPITGEQTGGLSAARLLYCFNRGTNGAFGATGMLSEKHVPPTFQ